MFANEQGFRIDASCFVPALRSSAAAGEEARTYLDFEPSSKTSFGLGYVDSNTPDWDRTSPPQWGKSSDDSENFDRNRSFEPDDSESGWDPGNVIYRPGEGAANGAEDAGDAMEAPFPGEGRGTRERSLMPSEDWSDRDQGFAAGEGVVGEGALSVRGAGEGSDGEGEGASLPSEAAVVLLGRMEAEAGIAPDCWCVNVVMEVIH